VSRLSKVALVVAVLAASVFVGLTTEKASAFEVGKHEGMTVLSLPFLRAGVLEDVVDEHGGFADNTGAGKGSRVRWLHVDGCSFDETVQQINSLQADAVQELVPGAGFDPWSASDHFGLPLHPAQDFYSHSNWVELGFPVADDPATVDNVEGESVSDLVDLSTTFAGPDQLGPWGVPQDHRGLGSAAPSFGVVRGDILLDDMVVGKDPLVRDEHGILHVHDINGNGMKDEGDAVIAELDPGWQIGLLPDPTLPSQPGLVPGIADAGGVAVFQYFQSAGPFLVPMLLSAPRYRLLTSGVGDRDHIEAGDVFSSQCDPFVRGADGQVIEPHQVNTCPVGLVDAYSCISKNGSRFALAHGGTGGLNKDNEDAAGYPQALALAVLQTKYEWCRFVKKAGDAGSDGVLLALWVKENASPHPSGTPCTADDGAGPMGVTVTINGVDVLDDKEQEIDEPGEFNLSLVLYDSPATFSRSDQSKSEPVNVDDDGSSGPSSVPATELPAPVEMCVHASDPTFRVALHGWDDDDDDGPNGDFNQDVDLIDRPNSDDAVIGFSATHAPPALGAATTHYTTSNDSNDLRIAYTVARVPDTDGDGLDACGEPFYGTDPARRDTDGDGLGDGTEVDGTNATNPLVADSDGDGLSDGREDVNANGALDPGETNPNDRDSDDDLLSDGVEVDGSNPTDPLDADSDGDGLNDGREDVNLNGALDPGETNPNNADSDADGLTDGQEVEFGTNPLDADSDDDGLADGRDVDWIVNAIRALPASAIKSPADGNRNAMLNLLADAEALLRKGKLTAARDKLTTLRKRVDGCGTAADGNDWIVDCTHQLKIRSLVDLLLANV
jgi:hypothetical protein